MHSPGRAGLPRGKLDCVAVTRNHNAGLCVVYLQRYGHGSLGAERKEASETCAKQLETFHLFPRIPLSQPFPFLLSSFLAPLSLDLWTMTTTTINFNSSRNHAATVRRRIQS